MRLAGNAYSFLKDCGFLDNFGKFRNIVLEGLRDVTQNFEIFNWFRSSSALLIAMLGGVSFLLNQRQPNLTVVLGLAMLEAIVLGGDVLVVLPLDNRFLYLWLLFCNILSGCPIRGVILDPIVAFV
ncbi:hypothetical protein LIER_37494 [Lithospermum erythrorhizon]|uniref:Uncharacterized protein n=1 Tax=Lithospermum erythrorhizon TaxID=34254 RepID=A0AAV3PMQ9_LITER